MAVDLGVDDPAPITISNEPPPRAPVVVESGRLSREYLNWFNGKDRLLGEVTSGVNRYQQTIVSLIAATEGELGTLEASISSVATISTTNETAIASLQTEVTAARQGEVSLSAKISDVVTAQVAGDAANASAITTLTATVDGNTADITTNATAIATVDGKLSASYAITLDVNGRVTGLKLLNDGTTTSFDVNADAFRVFNGSSNIPVFAVSGGSIYLNGPIVTTDSLDTNAVNDSSYQYTAGNLTVSDTYQTMASASLTVPSGSAFVIINWQAFAQSLGLYTHISDSTLQLQVLRGATQIFEGDMCTNNAPYTAILSSGGTATIGSDDIILPGNYKGTFSASFIDTSPGSGTVTYTIQVRRKAVSGSPTRSVWTVSQRQIILDLRKDG